MLKICFVLGLIITLPLIKAASLWDFDWTSSSDSICKCECPSLVVTTPPSPAKTTTTTTTVRISNSESSSTENLNKNSQCLNGLNSGLLEATNNYRSKHCSSHLTLNNDLVQFAQSYAEKLAERNIFAHNPSRNPPSLGYLGENLYMESSTEQLTFDFETCSQFGRKAVDRFYSEEKDYSYSSAGSSDPSAVIGHFTQLVWRDSTSQGAGISIATTQTMQKYFWSDGTVEERPTIMYSVYVVVNYKQGGNVLGQYARNVLDPSIC